MNKIEDKIIKARYRNKLKKIIIEVWNGEKWLYVKTLADPLIEFKQECLDKVSLNCPKIGQKESEKFAQSLLNELQNKDTLSKNESFAELLFKDLGLDKAPIRKLTPEEIIKAEELVKE